MQIKNWNDAGGIGRETAFYETTDFKGSIILELAIIMEISTGYLLNNECDADDMDDVEKEMFALLKNMKSENLRKVALEQLRTLTAIET